MANTLEYAIKIRDLTRQGLNSARSGIESFARGTNNRLLGMFLRGGIVAGLAMLGRSISQWSKDVAADTTGAFNAFQKSGASAINHVSGLLSEFAKQFKGNVVGGLGDIFKFYGVEPTNNKQADPEKFKSSAARVDAVIEKTMGDDKILNKRRDQLLAIESEISDAMKSEAFDANLVADLLAKKAEKLSEILALQDKITNSAEKEKESVFGKGDKGDRTFARLAKAAASKKAEAERLERMGLSSNLRRLKLTKDQERALDISNRMGGIFAGNNDRGLSTGDVVSELKQTRDVLTSIGKGLESLLTQR